MKKLVKITDDARERAKQKGLMYAGSLTPVEAYALLQADSNIKLIDVRTRAEHDWVGRVTISETQYAEVQWYSYPERALNENFVAELGDIAEKKDVLLFLCRAGIRSGHAATLAAENGFFNCFNILEGFEGEQDQFGHRKTVNGWCFWSLPWIGA